MLETAFPSRLRVAIFKAHWFLQSSVYYMASVLEREGYHVDIFLYKSNDSFASDLLKNTDSIKIYHLGNAASVHDRPGNEKRMNFLQKTESWIQGIKPLWFLFRLFRFAFFKIFPKFGLIPGAVRQEVIAMATRNPYALLIGVEKGGLYWAGEVAEHTNTPLVYYNLELFSRDDVFAKRSKMLMRLKPFEEKYHSKCSLTIVQDVERGKILLSDNRVRPSMKMAYLPVSLAGDINSDKSEWLQNEFGFPPDTIAVLYFGFIATERACDKLVETAQLFPEKWRLVFHGPGVPQEIEEIRQLDKRGRIKMSLRLVPIDECEAVIRSAHIGLALYQNDSVNNVLTGFASEKIAMYFKCGIPLIAFRYPSYGHIEQEQAGVLIDRLDEIPAAIEKILSDYNAYVQGAYACYQRHYCFETNFPPVLASLQAVQRN